jgi:hypothetical protein
VKRKKSNQPNVGAWLGGNKGYLRSGEQSDQTSAKVDAGGGEMDAVRRELGLGAYAAGIGTTAAIGAGVAAVRSGVAARVANKVTGQTVIVHSSPAKGLKTIEPRIAPARPEMGARVYAARPFQEVGTHDPYEMVVRTGKHYIRERNLELAVKRGESISKYEGSMYVAKVPSKTLEGPRGFVSSPASAKVVKEIPILGQFQKVSDDYSLAARHLAQRLDLEYAQKLEKAFRRAGGRVKGKKPKEPKMPKQKPTRS